MISVNTNMMIPLRHLLYKMMIVKRMIHNDIVAGDSKAFPDIGMILIKQQRILRYGMKIERNHNGITTLNKAQQSGSAVSLFFKVKKQNLMSHFLKSLCKLFTEVPLGFDSAFEKYYFLHK